MRLFPGVMEGLPSQGIQITEEFGIPIPLGVALKEQL